jgi:hypothetical protein
MSLDSRPETQRPEPQGRRHKAVGAVVIVAPVLIVTMSGMLDLLFRRKDWL